MDQPTPAPCMVTPHLDYNTKHILLNLKRRWIKRNSNPVVVNVSFCFLFLSPSFLVSCHHFLSLLSETLRTPAVLPAPLHPQWSRCLDSMISVTACAAREAQLRKWVSLHLLMHSWLWEGIAQRSLTWNDSIDTPFSICQIRRYLQLAHLAKIKLLLRTSMRFSWLPTRLPVSDVKCGSRTFYPHQSLFAPLFAAHVCTSGSEGCMQRVAEGMHTRPYPNVWPRLYQQRLQLDL